MSPLQWAVLRLTLAPGLVLLALGVDQAGWLPSFGGLTFAVLIAAAVWLWFRALAAYRAAVAAREAEIAAASARERDKRTTRRKRR